MQTVAPEPRAGIPIGIKLLVAPVLAVVSMIAFNAFSDHLLAEISATTRVIGERRIQTTADVLGASGELNGAVMELYYGLASAGSGKDANAAIESLKGASTRILRVKEALASAIKNIDDEASRTALKKVSDDLARFEKPIAFVQDMIGIDPQGAVSFVEPLHQNLAQVQDELSRAAANERARAQAEVTALDRRAGAARALFIIVGALVGIAVAAAAAYTLVLVRGMTQSISGISQAMTALADGDLKVDVDKLARRDNLGAIVRALRIFQRQAVDMAEHIEGDAEAVHIAAQEIAGAVDGQASHAAAMSASVAEITSTMEELSSSSAQVAEYSRSVAEMADRTWEGSKTGTDAMRGILARMDEISADNRQNIKVTEDLGRKSKEITKIMSMIESVADQTKLIAFNAALEAASAGEAGRRFGVVASEIRRLADNVTESAGEIGQKVGQIQNSITHLVVTAEKGGERIETGMKETGRVAEMLSELESAARESTSAARQISLATQQQRTASGQVVVALHEIVGASTHTAQSAAQISDVARTMMSLSKRLHTLIGRHRQRPTA